MNIFDPDKFPSSDQAASSSSKIKADLQDHRKQCAADKSAAAVRINGLELKILQLGSDFRGLAGSEGKRIDFVVASLGRYMDDGVHKAEAIMISYVDYHTNELRIHLVGEINQVNERVDEVRADLKTYVQKSEASLGQHVDGARQELKNDIAEEVEIRLGEHIDGTAQDLKGDLSGNKQELKEEMGQAETRLNKRIDDNKHDLKGDLSGNKQELKEEISGTKQELKEEISGNKQELKEEISGNKQELKEEISGNKQELKEEIRQAETRLNKRIDDTKQDLKGEVGQVETRLNKRIDDTRQDLKGEMGQVETRLNKRIDDTKQELRGELSDTKQELKTDIKQSEERLNKRMDRTDTRILWSTLITTLLVAFMNIFGKEAFHSLFNAAVDIFEKVLSFFS